MATFAQNISIGLYQLIYNLPELFYSVLAIALLLQIIIYLKQFEREILINIPLSDTSEESKMKKIYKKTLINSIRVTLVILITFYFLKIFNPGGQS